LYTEVTELPKWRIAQNHSLDGRIIIAANKPATSINVMREREVEDFFKYRLITDI